MSEWGQVHANGVVFVGLEAVQRQHVLFGEQANGGNAEFRRRAHDADGDYAKVGAQDPIDGRAVLHRPVARAGSYAEREIKNSDR
jgi:hypothetical protein